MPYANPKAARGTTKPFSLFPPTKELSDWTNADIKKKARVNPRVSEDRLRTRVNTARKEAGKGPLLTVDQQVKAQRAEAKAKSEANRKASGWVQPKKTTPKTTATTPSKTTSKARSKTTKAGAAKKAKTSFRERRAARLERRIAQPWGSEERKKLQRKRLKRVKGRMAEGGDVKKKSGGAVKMQGGGLSRAQQNMLRQAQEYAASSGQNPAALRKLTAQHGDLYGQQQQGRAQRQMAGNQPGRTSMRGIGPGMKKGGMAKQGANARLDESLGERRGKESKKSQSFKSRRNESRGARKKSRPESAGAAKRGWGAAIR